MSLLSFNLEKSDETHFFTDSCYAEPHDKIILAKISPFFDLGMHVYNIQYTPAYPTPDYPNETSRLLRVLMWRNKLCMNACTYSVNFC